MIRRRGGGRRRVENSCLHPDDTPSRVSEVGHVEKSSSENSRWECLLGNGPEGQEVKIQSQSRFQVGWLCSPTVPSVTEEPDLQGWPPAAVSVLGHLDCFLPGCSRLCCSECLTQVGDHPSSCLDWRREERKGLGEGGRFATWTSQHCPYRRDKI